MIENPRANLRLVDGRLVPGAFDAIGGGNTLPLVDTRLVSILVGTDRESVDVLQDWRTQVPHDWAGIGLSATARRSMQRRRLFLRNRRVVCGYELLDRALRELIGGGDPAKSPPTWLTVGKWTARGIGELLEGRIVLPGNATRTRRTARLVLRPISRWRVVPMGRILVMGNREIFAQVASVLTVFVRLDFSNRYDADFPTFVSRYGNSLLGRFNPAMADELLFPIRAVVRDPLSDSLLRSLHAYYRAIGAVGPADREAWVLIGNLHLAAYEQQIAQTFVDMALSLRPSRVLKDFLDNLEDRRADAGDGAKEVKARPLDMVLERKLPARLFDLIAAAFATRFIISIGVGLADHGPAMVFAPGMPMERVGAEPITQARAASQEALISLQGIWLALDRAQGVPARSIVRDWRNYRARISYIANLFAIADRHPPFSGPVFTDDEMMNYLRGVLPTQDGVALTDSQAGEVRRLLDAAGEPRGLESKYESA
jgi:hypothetical protein